MAELVRVDFERGKRFDNQREWLADNLRDLADAVESGHVEARDGDTVLSVNDPIGLFTVFLGSDGQFSFSTCGGKTDDWSRIMSILARATHLRDTEATTSLLRYAVQEASGRRQH